MKMPQGWDIKAAAQPETTKVEGKINMSSEVVGQGLCPECQQPMQEAIAGKHKVWACVRDRVALPLPNEVTNEDAIA